MLTVFTVSTKLIPFPLSDHSQCILTVSACLVWDIHRYLTRDTQWLFLIIHPIAPMSHLSAIESLVQYTSIYTRMKALKPWESRLLSVRECLGVWVLSDIICVSASAGTVRWRLLEDGLVSRRAAKKPGKTSGTDWYSEKGTGIGLLRTGVK